VGAFRVLRLVLDFVFCLIFLFYAIPFPCSFSMYSILLRLTAFFHAARRPYSLLSSEPYSRHWPLSSREVSPFVFVSVPLGDPEADSPVVVIDRTTRLSAPRAAPAPRGRKLTVRNSRCVLVPSLLPSVSSPLLSTTIRPGPFQPILIEIRI
jgi:hypothetical protein